MITKTTKRALLMSSLALLVCFSMFIGTTFAWFTDTASTGVNTIQSGTLKVDLQDSVSNSLEGKTLTFVQKTENGETTIASPLWEPGATFVTQQFKVVNNGNLNLKYTIVITGIDGDAKLNEVMEWSVVEGDTEVTTLTGTLAPGAATPLMNLKGHMKEEATNEYQGLSMSGIGITVYATQVEAEYDSFGNEYDKDASLTATPATIDDVLANAKAGATIKLEAGAYTALNIPKALTNLTIIGGKGVNLANLSLSNNRFTEGGVLYGAPKGLTLVGLNIADVSSVEGGSVIYNLTIKNCNFADGINFSANSTINGVTIENCSFANIAQGDGKLKAIQFNGVASDVTIKNNTFTNIEYNAINFSNSKTTGKIEVIGNTINDCGSRAVRGAVAPEAVITISGNTITNAIDGTEVIKVTGATAAITFENNTYGGVAITMTDGVANAN